MNNTLFRGLALGALMVALVAVGFNATGQMFGIQALEILSPSIGNQARVEPGEAFSLTVMATCDGPDIIKIQIQDVEHSQTEFLSCSASGNGPSMLIDSYEVNVPESAESGVYDVIVTWGIVNQSRCLLCVVVED